MPRKRTTTVHFSLRLREDLRRQLEAAANKENRSLNEEMVARLEESFKRETADKILDKSQAALDEAQRIAETSASVLAKLQEAVGPALPLTNALLTGKKK